MNIDTTMSDIKPREVARLLKRYLLYIVCNSRSFFWLLIGLSLTEAIIPFIQTKLITDLFLVAQLHASSHILLVMLSVVTIAAFCLSKITIQISLHVQARINSKAYIDLTEYQKSLKPNQIHKTDYQDEIEFAYQGLYQGKFVVPIATITSAIGLMLIYGELFIQLGFNNIGAALLMFIALILQLIPLIRFGRKEQEAWTGEQQFISRARYLEYQLSHYNEALELDLFNARNFIANKAIHERLKIMKLRKGLELFFAKDTATISLISIAMAVLAMYLFIKSGVAISSLIASIYLISAALMQNINSAYVLGEFASCVPYMTAILKLQNVEQVAELKQKLPVKKIDEIDLKDIHFGYSPEKEVINGVNLSLKRGQVVALVGANGAGKTTLISLLLGLYKAQSGSITINGQQIETLAEVGDAYDMVLQDFGEYEIRVKDYLTFGDTYSEAEKYRALNLVGLDALVEQLRLNPNLQLGEEWGGVNLSGGQWQRLALARVLLRKRPIRVLDEFTSNIDADAEEEIFEIIKKQSQNYITLIVTHRAWTLKHADMIYVLLDGHIVEAGSYDELRAKGREFNRLFSFQKLSTKDDQEANYVS